MREILRYRGISSTVGFRYALETDWPVGAGGFEPLHLRIRIREDSQPGAAGFEPLHLRIEIYHDSQPGGQDSNLRISNCSAEAALFNKVSGVRPTTLSHDEVQQI